MELSIHNGGRILLELCHVIVFADTPRYDYRAALSITCQPSLFEKRYTISSFYYKLFSSMTEQDEGITESLHKLTTNELLELKKQDLPYTACYCEENIYMLLKDIEARGFEVLEKCSVLFLSNDIRAVPLWKQSAGHGADRMVVWDYHVVLLFSEKDKSMIYDFDTTLPFPCAADVYFMETFRPELPLEDRFKPKFRCVSAEVYLKYFESDRSHMLNENGTFVKPPPPYPALTKGQHKLEYYISMTPTTSKSNVYGDVFTCDEFYSLIFRKP